MELITEQNPVVPDELRKGLRFVGDSVDFGMAPVPRIQPIPTVEQPQTSTAEARKNWGIR